MQELVAILVIFSIAADSQLLNGDAIRCVKSLDNVSVNNSSSFIPHVRQNKLFFVELCEQGAFPVLDANTLKQNQSLGNGLSAKLTVFGNHMHALGSSFGRFSGLASTLSVWNPRVISDGQSISQIWVASSEAGLVQTVEAGWHVYPYYYGGSSATRLFVYWTADGYSKTGCYNLDCKGFVQVSRKVVLGGSIPVGSDITLAIIQDKATRNWWLKVNDESVGYWPASLLKGLQNGAMQVAAGGEVVSVSSVSSSQMGNGFFPSSTAAAAYHRNIRVFDLPNQVARPAQISNRLVGASRSCYGIGAPQRNANWGTFFFFGGPGCK